MFTQSSNCSKKPSFGDAGGYFSLTSRNARSTKTAPSMSSPPKSFLSFIFFHTMCANTTATDLDTPALQKTKIFSFSSLFEEKKLVVSWRIESKSASTASSKTIGWTVTFDFTIVTI
jgi:hypothetical protein